MEIEFNFYGVRVHVTSDAAEIIDWLKFDFSYFVSDQSSFFSTIDVKVQISESRPTLPPLVESSHSPKFVCYDQGKIRYVDYYGKALVVHNQQEETAEIYSIDMPFCYEKTYLFILSRVGEILDKKGFHRVHSLGISTNGEGTLFLLPERGGKSTLALSLLTDPHISLISEDTPLIDSKGTLFPFPLRLGLREGELPTGIKPENIRNFPREEGGVKHLIHIDFIKNKIERNPIKVEIIFIGKWFSSDEPKIHKASRLSLFTTLMRDCVFGLGLPQVVEFFLRSTFKDKIGMVFIFLRRLYACFALSFIAQPYEFYLSRNKEKNRDLILKFLRNSPSHASHI